MKTVTNNGWEVSSLVVAIQISTVLTSTKAFMVKTRLKLLNGLKPGQAVGAYANFSKLVVYR